MTGKEIQASVLLTSMANGIGDLAFASPEWIDCARELLTVAAARYAEQLKDLKAFTFCEVAHNPPVYMRSSPSLAWHVRFQGSRVEVQSGELPEEECDYKVIGDHSIMSNIARIQDRGKDPALVSAARDRLNKLGKWKITGAIPSNPTLARILGTLHDNLAIRTMPRFVAMTPEWVSIVRHILTTRSLLPKYIDGIKDTSYIFSEEFINPPAYLSPDDLTSGCWIHCKMGTIIVGSGPLPNELQPADSLMKGLYKAAIPLIRTVNASMTKPELELLGEYSKSLSTTTPAAIVKSSPSEKGNMPTELARIFMPLHDEMSKRTSGELPSDFDPSDNSKCSSALEFDRHPSYDSSWLRYDKVDYYGNPLL